MGLQLNYLFGGEVVYQPGDELPPRMLTDHELVFMMEGCACYTVDSTTFHLSPGGMVLGRPGQVERYRWDPRHKTRHAYFHYGIERVPDDWPDPAQWPHVRAQASALARQLFFDILQHIYRHDDWPATPPSSRYSRLVAGLMDEFFTEPMPVEITPGRERPDPVQRVLQWMRQQLDDAPQAHIDLRDAARVAGVSEKHLCRLFSKSIGYSPMKTCALLRQQLALALLTRTNLRIGEISERCGFENPLYFSRCFQKVYGQAPSGVRNALAAGRKPPSNPLPVDLTPRLF
jgi:AraC family transcriptional regulator